MTNEARVMSEYKLDMMLEDVEPWLQVCFAENAWVDVNTKRKVLNYLNEELKHMGVDDDSKTDKMLAQLCEDGEFNELGYFDDIEYLLNKAGYFTYNSDNWFEVYVDSDETHLAISEALAQDSEVNEPTKLQAGMTMNKH